VWRFTPESSPRTRTKAKSRSTVFFTAEEISLTVYSGTFAARASSAGSGRAISGGESISLIADIVQALARQFAGTTREIWRIVGWGPKCYSATMARFCGKFHKIVRYM